MMSMCFQKSEFESSLDFLVHSIDRQYFTPRMKGLGVGSFDWKESHSVTDCRMIPTSECQINEVTFNFCIVQRMFRELLHPVEGNLQILSRCVDKNLPHLLIQ